jgi:hypothetical protein
VPLSEPDDISVLWLPIRSTLKLPVALANRPVPSVMVAFSAIVTMPFATIPVPVNVPERLSPFAAVSVKVPTVVDGAITPIVMSNTNPTVYRPKCVACPVPVRTECRTGNAPVWTSLASRGFHETATPNHASPRLVQPHLGGWTVLLGRFDRHQHMPSEQTQAEYAYRIVILTGECFSSDQDRPDWVAVGGC